MQCVLWVELPLKSDIWSGSTGNKKKCSVYKYCKKGILAMWNSTTSENMKKPVHNC